jgi:hypothetical protein
MSKAPSPPAGEGGRLDIAAFAWPARPAYPRSSPRRKLPAQPAFVHQQQGYNVHLTPPVR